MTKRKLIRNMQERGNSYASASLVNHCEKNQNTKGAYQV